MTLILDVRTSRWNLAHMAAHIAAQIQFIINGRYSFAETVRLVSLVTILEGANV
jgi:hypothetical protein